MARIFRLFDKYFLILMLIQSLILIFYDGAIFKRKDEKRSMIQARSIGIPIIIISVALYILSRFI